MWVLVSCTLHLKQPTSLICILRSLTLYRIQYLQFTKLSDYFMLLNFFSLYMFFYLTESIADGCLKRKHIVKRIHLDRCQSCLLVLLASENCLICCLFFSHWIPINNECVVCVLEGMHRAPRMFMWLICSPHTHILTLLLSYPYLIPLSILPSSTIHILLLQEYF